MILLYSVSSHLYFFIVEREKLETLASLSVCKFLSLFVTSVSVRSFSDLL